MYLLEKSKTYQRQYLSELQKLEVENYFNNNYTPGLISDDGSSILGKEGWIFIHNGSNNFLEYFLGKKQLSYQQIDEWKKILNIRVDWHNQKNINYLHLFVPNKLAIYPEFFPEEIKCLAERPIIQLQQFCPKLFIYPLEIFIKNKEIYRLYEKQNSHWSFWGCFLIYEMLCHKFGITPNHRILEYPIKVITELADLGVKFNLYETRLEQQAQFDSKIIYDNKLINYCNRGSIRILKNYNITSGKMLIFGDSYSNPGYPDYSNQRKRHIHRLTSLFAETIREVHFIWSPWIDYNYIKKENPDFVLTEMAERFLIKVPKENFHLSIQKYVDLKLKEYNHTDMNLCRLSPSMFVGSNKNNIRIQYIKKHINNVFELDILEIGAFDNPTFLKEEANIYYCDYFSREELEKKYAKDKPKRAEKAVNVDYVIKEGRYSDRLEQKFDLVIANHVIEHIPNMIGWLQDISLILKKDGFLFLTVPHKEYTFDKLRSVTSLQELIRNYYDNLKAPTIYHVFEQLYYHRPIKAGDVWNNNYQHLLNKKRFDNIDTAWHEAQKRMSNSGYVDVHCSVFTYESFIDIINELQNTQYISFNLYSHSDVVKPNNEFYVLLKI